MIAGTSYDGVCVRVIARGIARPEPELQTKLSSVLLQCKLELSGQMSSKLANLPEGAKKHTLL